MSIQRHVLVTGATGFLGKHLTRFLADQPGIDVLGVSKNGGQLGSVRVDSLDLDSAKQVSTWRIGKPSLDAVFHLAATVPSSFYSDEADRSFIANLSIMQNALSLAIMDKAVFVYASSSSVYGPHAEGILLTEEVAPKPDNMYSLGKYVGELACGIAQVRHNLPIAILRISAPYGPLQKTRSVVNIFLRSAILSQNLTLYGSGNRTQDFTFVGDVVRAMWLAYQRRIGGVYNIASGQAVTMRELAETVLAIVPDTKSQIEYSGHLDPQETYHGIFPIDKARRELGFLPLTNLRQGLEVCVRQWESER